MSIHGIDMLLARTRPILKFNCIERGMPKRITPVSHRKSSCNPRKKMVRNEPGKKFPAVDE